MKIYKRLVMEYKYFSRHGDPNIACRCGCGLSIEDMDRTFMTRIDVARQIANIPFIIISGIRCPAHNNNVSTTGFDGPHTTGQALDIFVRNSNERYIIRRVLIMLGFNRFGTAESFLHVDSSPDHPQNVEWLY